MVNNSWFKRLLYKIYKMQWCEEHHCNLEDVDEEIGINGECYVCYDEFIDNELEDEEVVKGLIEWFTTLNENEKGCSLCLQKTSGSSSTHIFNLNNSEFYINKVEVGVWHNFLMINVTTTLGIDIPIALKINYCPYCGKKLTYDGGDKTYDDFLSLLPRDCYVPKKVSVRGCSFCKISASERVDTICFSGFNRAYEFPVTSIEIQLYEGHIDITFKIDDEQLLLRESVNYCPFCGIALEDEVEN